jgi:hypothetical protein
MVPASASRALAATLSGTTTINAETQPSLDEREGGSFGLAGAKHAES